MLLRVAKILVALSFLFIVAVDEEGAATPIWFLIASAAAGDAGIWLRLIGPVFAAACCYLVASAFGSWRNKGTNWLDLFVLIVFVVIASWIFVPAMKFTSDWTPFFVYFLFLVSSILALAETATSLYKKNPPGEKPDGSNY
jgi:hypothetical protein